MSVPGKRSRVKNWVAGQQIDSFSDLEGDDGSSDDGSQDDQSQTGVNGRDVNGVSHAKEQGGSFPDPSQDWENFEDVARKCISSIKTSIRLPFLNNALIKNLKKQSLSPQQSAAIFKILVPTYPRYIDRPSRDAVQECVNLIITTDLQKQSGKLSEAAVKWLETEVTMKVCSPTSFAAGTTIVNLLAWIATVFDAHAKALGPEGFGKDHKNWQPLLKSMAVCYDASQIATLRDAVRKSGTTNMRRTVRQNALLIPDLLKTIHTPGPIKPSTATAALLGLVIDVSLRIKKTKMVNVDQSTAWVQAEKPAILAYYREHILASRTPLLPHITTAFNDFVGSFVTPEDLALDSELVKAMDRALLRNPEVALTTLDVFFTAYTSPTTLTYSRAQAQAPPTEVIIKKLLPQIVSAAKSSNALVRSSAALLYNTIVSSLLLDPASATTVLSMAREVAAPIRTNKSASPEHRTALSQMLLSMLSSEEPSLELAGEIADSIVAALAKEANEAALQASLDALTSAMVVLLKADQIQKVQTSITALAKGAKDVKVNIRRCYLNSMGELFWRLAGQVNEPNAAEAELVKAILPALEAAVKNASTVTAGSAVEGWIATAVLQGVLSKWKIAQVDTLLQKDFTLQSLLSHSPKPSFLLAERAYKKPTSASDEIWLVRSLESILLAATAHLASSDQLARTAASLPLLHVALESAKNEHRKDALRAIENIARCESEASADTIFVSGLGHWLAQTEKQDQLAMAASEEHRTPDRSSRLQALLLSLARAANSRQLVIAKLSILAHHSAIAATRPSLWVDLAIAASCDPAEVASYQSAEILSRIAEAQSHESATFVRAAYSAISTVVFVAPDTYLPVFIEQIRGCVDAANLSFVGDVEMGILGAPEDTPFVDVLATSKGAATTSKGKNAAIDKWDEETRKALEAKKRSAGGGVAKLSKGDQALFDEQLRKEKAIRARILTALADIRKGFQMTQSLLKSGSTDLLKSFIPVVLSPILTACMVPQAQLYKEEAFQTVLRLYGCCSDRISDVRLSLALAVLRGARSSVVPADFDVEDLPVLATRVLYRLRFQSEREPFDPSTYALAAPLLHRCIQEEGIGVSKGDNDASMEQLALAIDVILFHVNKFVDASYPRLETIQNLVLAIAKYPSLSQPASSAIQDLGGAIENNASSTEISALLQSMMAEEAQVRHACLQALTPLDLTDLDYTPELWIVCQDGDERNADLASTIWEDNGLDVKENAIDTLAGFLEHKATFVRASAAVAIARAVEQVPSLVEEALRRLARDYKEAAKERLPEYDRFGMLIEASLHQEDPWQARSAHAEALQHLAPLYESQQVGELFRLLVADQALGDRSEQVRSKMLDAGIATIDAQGKANLQPLMTRFQDYLGSQSASNEVGDRVTEAVIVLLGRLARHLDSTDPRVGDVIERLLAALKTPSEIVQIAVSDCLPPLVRANSARGAKVIEQLLRETLQASRYAERRGAAYGLAGAVKGRGITSMKEFDIMTRLQDAAEDKKNQNARQGAMFAFETLSATLGRLFEPYIIKILPLLLTCLGDTSTDVRDATADAAKVIMSRVSGHAVKQILPVLLDALQERQWRTKKGAIELMGAMAYLAPRQLSRSLPTIIPPLTEVLTDTHTQVRTSANASLKKFGEVVDNPEIQAMQSTLLSALVDPTKKTGKALDTLLTTSFVHYIDTSSLALIIPIIDRGLRERSTDLKRKGAQIVGNMASLTDSKDLIPYLPQLVPRVREVLIDPVPEARATAAKSLGVLIERLGENAFPTLVDDLSDILHSDASGVDQQGAAQGLAEVLSGLGVERMESMLPDIIASTSSSRAYVREGYISLLIYLPSVFGDRFSPYLGRIIQPVLSGLADDSDFVREASMRAGRMIVNNHATKAIDLLLPELERGLFDQSWRIRLSSIQLIGELLFRISGISGKAEMEQEGNEEEDDAYTSNAEAAKKMLEVLGRDRRDRVLASLYILRQDSAGQVRMFSLNVWKALVTNTPRTVREILSSLMHTIIRLLASSEGEQREMTARTLGELCRKQGDRVLGEVIPILQKASQGNEAARQGCCLAFAEILETTTKAQLEGHEDDIINSVRGALVDDSAAVRQAAAQAFDALQTQIGPRSIDQTIPTLLAALTQAGSASEAALSALKELMAVRAQAIFPILIPTLIATPISAFNAQALGSLVGVAGSALNRRLAQILDALQSNRESQTDEDIKSELESTIKAVLGSVEDVEGLHMLMLHLLGLAKDPRVSKRIGGCQLFATFCQTTEEDFSAYHVDWLRRILALYEEGEDKVVAAAIEAMDALSKTLTKEHMEGLAPALRRTVETTSSAGNDIPGFCRTGGLKPILPILIQGLLAGTNEQREQSAYGLGDIVERTATDALKPHVTQITGPLIRIIAERYPPPVKAAILSTLAILLTKAPQFVRPFFPQLQRTFVKNLSELSSSTIRQKAAHGLGILMSLQPRIDPLITELVNGCSHDEPDVRDAMSNALGQVVRSGGANMTPPARTAVAGLVRATLEEPGKEAFNNGIARTLAGMLLHRMNEAEALIQMLLEGKATPLSSTAIVECLETAPSQLYETNSSRITSRILKNVVNEHPGVARPAREARELLKKTQPWSDDEDIQSRLA